MNTSFYLLLLIPTVVALCIYFYTHMHIKSFWTSVFLGAFGFLIGFIIFVSLSVLGTSMMTSDVQVLNGQITDKKRIHDNYTESYDCNCSQVCTRSGNNRRCRTRCDTCTRNHYTVEWKCYSNVGNFSIKKLDSTSQSVYNALDPQSFTSVKIGDPAAVLDTYTNYIKAAPESLFRPAAEKLKAEFAGFIPNYPSQIYDHFKINRTISAGVAIQDINVWNDEISTVLKDLGTRKQANIVIVITKFSNPNYYYALQDAWLNGKKNDVIVVIGAPEFPKKAAWVNVMSLSNDNILHVKIRDSILEQETLDAKNVVGIIGQHIDSSFSRKSMKEFKYLENEISMSYWYIIAGVVFNICMAIGICIWSRSNAFSFKRKNW